MKPLTIKRIFVFTSDGSDIEGVENAGIPISAQRCHSVGSYSDLLKKIAALNFHNSSLQLYYRGQTEDYQVHQSNSSLPVRSNLYPKILRSLPAERKKRSARISQRTAILEKADGMLRKELKIGYIHRHRLVRWSILQHYEVCATPMIDVTSSLQIALSFAVSNKQKDGFLFVFGLPHQSGPISTSVESMTQVIDLAKFCPPEFARPHFQCASFLADYPTGLNPSDLVEMAPRLEANFACRLVTKFRLVGLSRWKTHGFFPTPETILYPNDKDDLFPLMDSIRRALSE